MTPEGKVKDMLKRKLDMLPKTWRFMPVQNGMGKPGLDFFICAAGAFIAIETKVPGKKLTPRQEVTKAEIEAAGGKVFVVDDEASADYAVKYIYSIVYRLRGLPFTIPNYGSKRVTLREP